MMTQFHPPSSSSSVTEEEEERDRYDDDLRKESEENQNHCLELQHQLKAKNKEIEILRQTVEEVEQKLDLQVQHYQYHEHKYQQQIKQLECQNQESIENERHVLDQQQEQQDRIIQEYQYQVEQLEKKTEELHRTNQELVETAEAQQSQDSYLLSSGEYEPLSPIQEEREEDLDSVDESSSCISDSIDKVSDVSPTNAACSPTAESPFEKKFHLELEQTKARCEMLEARVTNREKNIDHLLHAVAEFQTIFCHQQQERLMNQDEIQIVRHERDQYKTELAQQKQEQQHTSVKMSHSKPLFFRLRNCIRKERQPGI